MSETKTKAWRREGIGQRIGRDLVRFEYRDGDIRVRRTVTKAELTAFLTNGLDAESNLGRGAAPVRLDLFLSDHYVPKVAKPRLPNPGSLAAEVDLTKALTRTLGAVQVHEITPSQAEGHRSRRLEEGCANNTLKKELRCLGRAMEAAMAKGLIKKNLLLPVKGLPSADRSGVWLKTAELDRLLAACPEDLRRLVAFLALTGCRIGEALESRAEDVKVEPQAEDAKVARGILLLPTKKRRVPARDCMRRLNIESLGPRFESLLPTLVATDASGRLFPFTYSDVNERFITARRAAGLDHVHLHDLRGGFAVHRALVVKSFRQLQYELGHRDAKSVQAYLDRAEQFDPRDSIFYRPPQPWVDTKVATNPEPVPTGPQDSGLAVC